MLAPLVCLLGLTLVGQDGPSASAVVDVESPWTVDLLTDAPARFAPADAPAAPLDDEFEGFPDEPEGDDEEDPSEAMGTKGTSGGSGLVASLAVAAFLATPPPPSSFFAPAVRAQGSPLSLLCRLRI